MKYNSKFNKMTTDDLQEELNQIRGQIEEKTNERILLSRDIELLRSKARRLSNTLKCRERSKYNGEFYVNSEFRKKYGKPYSQFTAEERHQYQKEYWETHKEELKEKKALYYLTRKQKRAN